MYLEEGILRSEGGPDPCLFAGAASLLHMPIRTTTAKPAQNE